MKRQHYRLAAMLLLAAGAASLPGRAEEAAPANDIASAIASGDVGVALRYRYEFVDQASFEKDANASTLRLRLNYRTGEWRHWTAFGEFDHIAEVFSTSFNSGSGTSSPRRDAYPVVADPRGSDLNQLYLQYAPNAEWQLRIGRQRIDLDDERFVGGVGWRQNEQTFDAFSIAFRRPARTEISYSYVANVNRIVGNTVPAGDHQQSTHLLNAAWNASQNWKITGYAYLIDNEDQAAWSSSTLGVRATGSLRAGDSRFDLHAEYASQSDYADNPASFDTDYYRLQAVWALGAFSAGAGIESLASDNGVGFSTPLATLHPFNGWADLFLSTPGSGLDDLYLRAGLKPGKWTLNLVYHDFRAETGSGDYGSEIDFSAARPLGSRYSVLLKFADFSADSASFQDTTKAWLMLTAAF